MQIGILKDFDDDEARLAAVLSVNKTARLVRIDVAWKLFLPAQFGPPADLPQGKVAPLLPLVAYLHDEMARRVDALGRGIEPDWMLWAAPALTPAAEEFLVRQASYASAHVVVVPWSPSPETLWQRLSASEERWTAPIFDLLANADARSPAIAAMQRQNRGMVETFFAALGAQSQLLTRVEEIPPGHASARLHNHSSVEEIYIILKGSGTLRTGSHSVPLSAGQLITKPAGIGFATQILNTSDEPLFVFDLEARRMTEQPDVIANPDHGEVVLTGRGLHHLTAQATLGSTEDWIRHYNEGYIRRSDGSYEPIELPGMPKRNHSEVE
ncbi:MAG: cupin domain-containing protein [Firmicutes bacterium]|nr:cupin domain-containing protein [Bacillota bacterium]